MKIALAQISSEVGNYSHNTAKHIKWVLKAIKNKADLIFFPELSLSGYDAKLAHQMVMDVNDPALYDFQEISDKYKIVIGLGIPTESESGLHISMIFFQPDVSCICYNKQILYEDELPYFAAGDEQIILNIKEKKIAPAICYESMQTSHIENACDLGADLYISSVAKSQNGIKKAYSHYPDISKKYKITVLMSNCIGIYDKFEGRGSSAAWNNNGELVGKLDNSSEALLIHDLKSDESKIIN